MYQSMKRLTKMFPAVCLALGLGSLARAQDDANTSPPLQHLLQYRGAVVVGADGNGVTAAQFPTTVAGDDVHYAMVVETGCPQDPNASGTTRPCPPAVGAISITLNDGVVFQTTDAFQFERVQVALNGLGQQNHIVISAGGIEGAAARVAVLALRPAPIAFGGRSVLPWAFTNTKTRTFMTVHNAGPANIAFRINFFNPDGSFAGRTAPRILSNFATVNIDLAAAATNLGLTWTMGAVHVQWGSRNFSRISTIGSEVHREPDPSGVMQVTNARALPLDDYGPIPLNAQDVLDLFPQN
jgi:hypothetical protein